MNEELTFSLQCTRSPLVLRSSTCSLWASCFSSFSSWWWSRDSSSRYSFLLCSWNPPEWKASSRIWT